MFVCECVYARICDNRLVVAGKVRQEGVGLEWVKGSGGVAGREGAEEKKNKKEGAAEYGYMVTRWLRGRPARRRCIMDIIRLA